ncbi:uncharacterized membrane protein YgdD (TMEM256/DUF423 family) [Dysgonomonas sp. PFB1-18]|uniref:DUF423 domain-containing protein n=1 Tax=unclassified Dysgonomonas TaxID=2630389 RepID=UPI00247430F6|nr:MULTISPECIES: DUF423 domain-containing protein [unclassified Dysgonomonas]MDH6307881.1 uncharacterized membrane protein YgdD (TMEM256/DUF423 family) [Dysgonomonas sp. PF1-14]MDH6337799.1 uncharacterized membrane protein YgdD (TMEM256/DUF423 family) [Dysgonomonas sp. PF1-16]MDH6379023.1 uncharacterized membrane protein YgdD (TMEM256/DUF423 family) [Dysgonomonas sp. PFB1-18]MDH6396658.1 uncharacterized membrane protein YgdD (TMEM256/DUF423 family) [Dysgonomonas sp. PF1-23]
MKQLVLIIASIYGMLSVILGAFGAHAFKAILSPEKLISFDTGVRYQMYHAIVLLIIGLTLSFTSSIEKWSAICIMIGVFLFSFSIYFLAFSEYWGVNLRFLGPVTPIGGMFMIVGWLLLVVFFVKMKLN